MWRYQKKKGRREKKTLKAFRITPTAFPVHLNSDMKNWTLKATNFSVEATAKLCALVLLILFQCSYLCNHTWSVRKKTLLNAFLRQHFTNSTFTTIFKRDNLSVVNWSCEIVYSKLPKSFQLRTHREVTVIITALCFSPSVLLKYECQLIFSRGPSTHFFYAHFLSSPYPRNKDWFLFLLSACCASKGLASPLTPTSTCSIPALGANYKHWLGLKNLL